MQIQSVYTKDQVRDMNMFYTDIITRLTGFYGMSPDSTIFTPEQISQYMKTLKLYEIQALILSATKVYRAYNRRKGLFKITSEQNKDINITIAVIVTILCTVIFSVYVYKWWGYHDFYSITVLSIIVGTCVIIVHRVVRNIEILDTKLNPLNEDKSIKPINNNLSDMVNLYELSKPTQPKEYDESHIGYTQGAFKKIIQESNGTTPAWVNLAAYITSFAAEYRDPDKASSNKALSDLGSIKSYFDKLDLFFDRQFQGRKHQNVAQLKMAQLYGFLVSQTVDSTKVNFLNTTLSPVEFKLGKVKEMIVYGLITNNVMITIQQDKDTYGSIRGSISEILGNTMLATSADILAQRIDKMLSQEKTNKEIINNKRRILANSTVLLNFVFKDVAMDEQMNGANEDKVVAPPMYVNQDTFMSMMKEMSSDGISDMINDTGMALALTTRAVNRIQKNQQESFKRADMNVDTINELFGTYVCASSAAVSQYLWDLWKKGVNDVKDEVNEVNKDIDESKKRADDMAKKQKALKESADDQVDADVQARRMNEMQELILREQEANEMLKRFEIKDKTTLATEDQQIAIIYLERQIKEWKAEKAEIIKNIIPGATAAITTANDNLIKELNRKIGNAEDRILKLHTNETLPGAPGNGNGNGNDNGNKNDKENKCKNEYPEIFNKINEIKTNIININSNSNKQITMPDYVISKLKGIKEAVNTLKEKIKNDAGGIKSACYNILNAKINPEIENLKKRKFNNITLNDHKNQEINSLINDIKSNKQ
jgi:hypothetical protein